MTEFLVKASLFNDHSFERLACNGDNNDSSISPNIMFRTEQKLYIFEFCTDDMVKVIKSLGQNKAHGHYKISVRMIKLFTPSIIKPLLILFSNCFENQCFPKECKKDNIVPVHKK